MLAKTILDKTIIHLLLEIAEDYQGYFKYNTLGNKTRIVLILGSNKIDVLRISNVYNVDSQKVVPAHIDFKFDVGGIVACFHDVSESKALEWLSYIIEQTRSENLFGVALMDIIKNKR